MELATPVAEWIGGVELARPGQELGDVHVELGHGAHSVSWMKLA